MSGRTTLAQAAVLAEIPLFLMDPTTGEGVTGVDPADTGFVARYRRAGQTSDTTMTLTAVAAGTALAANQWRDYGDGVYSLVGPAGLYATGARFVKVTVDCATPATLADVVLVALAADDALSASTAPAEVSAQVMSDFADGDGAAARAALVTAMISALRTENTTAAWGVSTTPPGGSSVGYIERRGSTPLGSRTAYFDSTGKMVGLTAVA